MGYPIKHATRLDRLPVFYTPRMVAAFESFSPSAGKPAQVIASWVSRGFPIRIMEPTPATTEELKWAHSPGYVDGVLACTLKNGFGNTLREVAATLPYTTGAMLSAAREAIRNGQVAVAPCSGFHHAGYDEPFGYCTFNGLMVTAFALKHEGLAERVGILDFDMHYGDGTESLIQRHQAGDWVRHYTAGAEYGVADQATAFLSRIPDLVKSMQDCDILLYQAGADPHIDDPLGGFLTTQQLRTRDHLVFQAADSLRLPVAWNLAGGYQIDERGGIRAVLEIHDNTMWACSEVYAGAQADKF